MTRDLTPIVCLCVYDRQRACGKWLRAWDNAEKFGANLVVMHNFDVGDGKFAPKVEQVARILEWRPDFYLPRVNHGGDVGAFKEFLDRKEEFPYWNIVLWFADDCMPMRKDFLKPFLEKISQDKVGLVGAFYEPVPVPHMRTCCFAIKREVAMRLRFPHNMAEPGARYLFEHSHDNLFRQVGQMGYKVDLAYGDFGTPWCQDQSLVWDIDHCFNHNLWDEFERQFSS